MCHQDHTFVILKYAQTVGLPDEEFNEIGLLTAENWKTSASSYGYETLTDRKDRKLSILKQIPLKELFS